MMTSCQWTFKLSPSPGSLVPPSHRDLAAGSNTLKYVALALHLVNLIIDDPLPAIPIHSYTYQCAATCLHDHFLSIYPRIHRRQVHRLESGLMSGQMCKHTKLGSRSQLNHDKPSLLL